MKQWRLLKSFGLFALCCLLLTQFTNCDMSSSGAGALTTLVATCQPDSSGFNPCQTQNPNVIQLQVNSGTTITIPAQTASFDIGGFCNEGGYIAGVGQSQNYIGYTFSSPNNVIISNAQAGSCVNGKFEITVGPIPTPAANQTINNTILEYQAYTLQVTLTVYDSNGNLVTPNSIDGSRTVIVQGGPPAGSGS